MTKQEQRLNNIKLAIDRIKYGSLTQISIAAGYDRKTVSKELKHLLYAGHIKRVSTYRWESTIDEKLERSIRNSNPTDKTIVFLLNTIDFLRESNERKIR